MIVNVIFHGAWVFVIDKANNKLYAVTPDEREDHKYEVGSFYQKKWSYLPPNDYELLGLQGSEEPVIPSKQLSPVISAESEQIRGFDPAGTRYCYLVMPMPHDIAPLEPYIIGNFLKGTAASQLQALRQFPAVQCLLYECDSLTDLKFKAVGSPDVSPEIAPNDPPNDDTANLHISAAYKDILPRKPNDPPTPADKEQMERCFGGLTLLFPGLNFGLKLPPDYSVKPVVPYPLPKGVRKDEVEFNWEAIGGHTQLDWGGGSNCQNMQFFLTTTSGISLP
jgi:hypothetical protein